MNHNRYNRNEFGTNCVRAPNRHQLRSLGLPPATQTTKKITNTFARKVGAPKTGRIEFRDTVLQGLMLRVSSSKRVYCLRHTTNGKRRLKTLGDANLITVEEARSAAREVLQRALAALPNS